MNYEEKVELEIIVELLEDIKQRERWRNDPVAYVHERLKLTTWNKLEEILLSIRDNRRTAVQSANGVGKTEIGAAILLWWIETHEQGIVLTTSGNYTTLEHVFWPRVRKLVQANNILPDATHLDMSIHVSDELFAYAKSTNEAEGLAGAHSPNTLALIEEGSGIEKEISDSIDGIVVGTNDKRVDFGNPLEPDGTFYNTCNSPSVSTIRISAFDHPNIITGENIIPGAISRQGLEELARKNCQPCAPNAEGAIHLFWLGDEGWYIPGPVFIARGLGMFPEVAEESLISARVIEDRMSKTIDSESNIPTVIGVDVARSEVGDESVIALANENGICRPLICGRGWPQPELEFRIIEAANEYGIRTIAIDGTGMGVGVCDHIEAEGFEVIRVMFGSTKVESDAYHNVKAEAYCMFADAIRENKEFILPKDPILGRQLKSLRRTFSPSLKIAIPDKAKVKSRTGESPDRAEACIIAKYAIGYSAPSAPPESLSSGNREQRQPQQKRYGGKVW